MSKLKTKKTFSKRFTITKRGKVIRRTPGQAHFNARRTGERTMGRRRDEVMRPGQIKAIKRLIKS